MNKISRNPLLFAALVIALAALEVFWLRWVLSEPLPNAGNVGGKIRRSLFLWRAFPEVVPGVRPEQSYFWQAARELSHFENLPQRIPIVLGASLIGGAGLALGWLVLRALRLDAVLTAWERLALAFGLGMSGLGVVTLLAGRCGLLAPWPVRVGLLALNGAGLAAWLVDRRRQAAAASGTAAPRGPKKCPASILRWAALAVVTGPFLLAMALGAMLPTIDFDAIEYHLQGPREYYEGRRMVFLPHNVYTSMPFGVEMLHLLGMHVMGETFRGALVGQLLVAAHAPAAAACVALTAWRWASSRAAWMATVVYLTTPWVYRMAVIPYVEGPLCYYHAALLFVVARVWPTESIAASRARFWLVGGVLAGGAMACKYPALLSAVVPFGALALADAARRRSPRLLLAYSLGWAVIMVPWLAKNVIDTGNPVYPLAYGVFGGREWDAARDAKWTRVHGRRPIELKAFVESFAEVVGRSDWQSPLYAALAPLALLRPGSRRRSVALWGYAVYLFLTWWLLTHRLDRFWLPILPVLAILAGIGADWVRHWSWDAVLVFVMGLSITTNFAYVSTALAGLNEWTGDIEALRTKVPEMLNRPLARLDAELPDGAKVLLVGQAAVFHFQHRIVYNTVFNQETIELLTRDRSAEQVREGLRRLGVTHVYVDWFEIERYRSPGNYGFTDYVQPAVFDRLVAEGVLERPTPAGPGQQLFRVR